jgi:hypothetical protein
MRMNVRAWAELPAESPRDVSAAYARTHGGTAKVTAIWFPISGDFGEGS